VALNISGFLRAAVRAGAILVSTAADEAPVATVECARTIAWALFLFWPRRSRTVLFVFEQWHWLLRLGNALIAQLPMQFVPAAGVIGRVAVDMRQAATRITVAGNRIIRH
jgi:hypothetical protein